ncbi:MAG: DUF5134 domain-containing protein [Acidimicrobiales bacterium]
MTGGPVADLLAVAVVGVTCFHAGRLVLSRLWRRSTQVDVDIVHSAMGVAMAGMLTGWLTGAWNDAWIAAFAVSTVWFGRRLGRRLSDPRSSGLEIAHHLPHFVASGVMLYMLWAMRWMGMAGGRAGSMGTMGTMGTIGHAGAGSLWLPSVVALLVVGNAAIAAWVALSPSLGVAAGPRTSDGMLGVRGAPACLFVMSVAMAYMVVAVHP